jgi:diguanylate cyclase (GGDEF)-like protein
MVMPSGTIGGKFHQIGRVLLAHDLRYLAGRMRTFAAFLRAFARGYTYDVRRNSYLWLGAFWGLLVPIFTLAFDVRLLTREGRGVFEVLTSHPLLIHLALYPILLGILFGAMGTVRSDLETENGRLLRTLEDLAMTDPLTGLYNRRFVKESLKNMVDSARRTLNPLSVILIDLNGFKAVNDDHGHSRGDRVLCDVAAALKSALRQSDVLGRHGGDEFILIDPSGRPSATRLLERAEEEVRKSTSLSLSAGIACWPEDGQTPDELIDAADRRLGASKRQSHEARTIPPNRGTPEDRSLKGGS